jgi:hypothetical protein
MEGMLALIRKDSLSLIRTVLIAYMLILTSAMGGPQQGSQTLTICPQGPPACQFSRIQEAIRAASPGDLLQLQAGTYEETLILNKGLRLVGVGRDRVYLKGKEAGKPTITLQVQGEIEILLDGLTIAGAPPASAEEACFLESPLIPSWEKICPNGLEVRGQGALILTLSDMQIVQSYAGLVCIAPAFQGSSVQLTVIRSRIAANQFSGISWGCSRDGNSTIILKQTVVSGNGANGLMSVDNGTSIEISDSTFSGNGFVGLSVGGHNVEVTISRSWFLDNGGGIDIQISMRGWAGLSEIAVIGNGVGVVLIGSEEAVFSLRDSTMQGNGGAGWGAGLSIASFGRVEIYDNLIGKNRHGIVVSGANPAKIYNNRILENEGWGIALDKPPCFEMPPTDVPRVIEGMGNEIYNNRQGDLCPTDYPWPKGFTTP